MEQLRLHTWWPSGIGRAGNHIGDDGERELAVALPQTASLTILNLQGTNGEGESWWHTGIVRGVLSGAAAAAHLVAERD